MQGDQALDGLWKDVENTGGWLRLEGSRVKWHPAPSQLSAGACLVLNALVFLGTGVAQLAFFAPLR
jgi:hypothetical protein